MYCGDVEIERLCFFVCKIICLVFWGFSMFELIFCVMVFVGVRIFLIVFDFWLVNRDKEGSGVVKIGVKLVFEDLELISLFFVEVSFLGKMDCLVLWIFMKDEIDLRILELIVGVWKIGIDYVILLLLEKEDFIILFVFLLIMVLCNIGEIDCENIYLILNLFFGKFFFRELMILVVFDSL